MNRLFLTLAAITSLFLISCGNQNTGGDSDKITNTITSQHTKLNHLEVYCFHGTRQCVTCKNMKAFTQKALSSQFEDQLKDSTILFQIVDVDLDENAAIAEKFEATGTALMVNKVVNGKDSIIDLSEFVFEKADNESKYISEFTVIIKSLLK